MRKNTDDQLKLLRENNYLIDWLIERFDEEERGNSMIGEGKMTLPFLLEMASTFENPDRFDANNFQSYDLPVILEYLEKTHDFYLNKKLPSIQSVLYQWQKNESHMLANCFAAFFEKYQEKVFNHIDEEERILFPYVRALISMEKGITLGDDTLLDYKISLIKFLMEHDHEIEDDLILLARTFKSYASSFKDSLAFRTIVRQIVSLERDLSIHARIEEEVLIPKSAQLEEKVLKGIDRL